MKIIAITELLLLFLLVSSSEAMIESCESVNEHLTPCLTYLAGMTYKPRPFCCEGAKNIVLLASKSIEDKRIACNCVKTLAQILIPKAQNAIDLPKKCGVQFPFEISATIDCSRVI
ncbi:non-specific lipid-transfer protein 1-like [Trifolium pratense]|uniref:non-specific lipid-transfer protein 1-like n=1 Tax=Trifolium pratense TaxID=57577 RepID=UPI001E694C2C|nr:non-specific lipid-transfer protein 1-like [Trifolium pratense]